MEEQILKTEEIPQEELQLNGKCLIWHKTEPTRVVGGGFEYGSRRRSQMMNFVTANDLDKDDYEFYHNLPEARTDKESFEYYHIRRRFVYFIQKFKPYIQNALMMKNFQKFIDAEKVKKEQAEKEQELLTTKTEEENG